MFLPTEGSGLLMKNLLHTRDFHLIAEYMMRPSNIRVLMLKNMERMDVG